MRVAYLQDVLSPFWCDFALAVREHGIDFQVLFNGRPSLAGRPAHWEKWKGRETSLGTIARVAPDGLQGNGLKQWFIGQLQELDPDVVIACSYKTWAAQPAMTFTRGTKPLGIWAEQPEPAMWGANWIKRRCIRQLMRGFDFCLAIGDRAFTLYDALMPKKGKTFLLPYSQDLSAFHDTSAGNRNGALRVLFSGQLIRRHNFHLITQAMQLLADRNSVGPHIRYCFSGDGPERWRLEHIRGAHPRLREAVELLDSRFSSWEDRAMPFKQADVFLYPSSYSGWGLAVCEALAAGLPVISTRQVEAARYFVTHGVNGLFVEQDAQSIAEAIQWFLKRRNLLPAYAEAARESAQRGSATFSARQFATLLPRAVA